MTRPELSAGDSTDRFIIEDVLGRGAASTVYRARHAVLGTVVALKVMPEPSGEERARLHREGRVQASLRHPNIVPVLDVVSLGVDVGLVLELIDGPDLSAWLDGRQVPLDVLDRIADGLFAGLEAAHRAGFVHRDLKPSNVLIQGEGADLVAKITDFGMVKATEVDGSTLTQTGWFFGTPAYAAPEQTRSARDVDTRADVFSLGALLYEVATGTRAFDGPDMVTVLLAASSERYVDPSTLRPDLPPRIRVALQGALRASCRCRWQDVASFRAAWMDLQPTLDRPGPAPLVAAEPIVADEASAAPAAAPPSAAAPAPVPDTLSPARAPWLAAGALAIGVLAAMLWALTRPVPTVAPMAQTPSPPAAPEAAAVASTPSSSAPSLTSPDVATATRVASPKPVAPRPRDLPTPPGTARTPPPTRASPPPEAVSAAPTTSSPDPAWVRVRGDAAEVVLFDALGKRVAVGALEPGTYRVEVRYDPDEPRVQAMQLVLGDGEAAEIACNAHLRRCTRKTPTP